ncbi:MAG: XdhC family protein [Bacteroidetes bacterium]|nr:XdhC family protein [Bacteroidota bacterium]
MAKSKNKKAALCIIVNTSGSTPRKIASKMVVFNDKSVIGSIGGGNLEVGVIDEAMKVIESNKAIYFNYNLVENFEMNCGGKVEVYIEPLFNQSKLLIFGGGHIGSRLARQAKELDFEVTIIDERKEIVDNISIEGITKIKLNHSEAFKMLNFDETTFITTMTHSHENDRDIVAFCAKQKFAYIGMIGSRRKVKTAKEFFLSKNLMSEDEIQKIDMPMGLKIECQTPEEIVISILAKLIDVRGKMK